MEENDTRSTEIPVQETGGDDTFPIGLKVLAIDANVDYLNHLVGLLRVCQYKVTGTSEAAEAIKLLNDKKEAFEIVITKVVNLDMDAFKLLEIIGLGMDIPVVVVSENDDVHVVMRAVREGAAAYLQAPVRLQELKVIWQHVLRKRLGRKRQEVEYREPRTTDNGASFLLSRKKHRVNWSKELHVRFVEAFEQLGEKERGPNNILRLMNVPGLTRDNIASHLQKHRHALRKKATEVGKLDSRRNYYLGNTRSSVASRVLTSGQFQYPRSTCTAAGSFTPVPQFNSLKFPSNPWDGYSGISPNDINPAYYLPLPSSSNCWSSTSQTSENYSSEIGGSPQQPVPIAGSFLSNNTVGQYCQPQFDMGSSQSSLTEDDLSEIFKLFQ